VSEGVPLAVMEAMGASLPVVATDVGGVPEVVVDAETGLLAPAKDFAGLAECVLNLAASPALRERFGAAGRRRAEQLFSDEAMDAAYDTLYQSLLPASRRRPSRGLPVVARA